MSPRVYSSSLPARSRLWSPRAPQQPCAHSVWCTIAKRTDTVSPAGRRALALARLERYDRQCRTEPNLAISVLSDTCCCYGGVYYAGPSHKCAFEYTLRLDAHQWAGGVDSHTHTCITPRHAHVSTHILTPWREIPAPRYRNTGEPF